MLSPKRHALRICRPHSPPLLRKRHPVGKAGGDKPLIGKREPPPPR
ncbi:Uncharacterized protein ChrSV_0145 [Chromobacterium vaccinii]|nr:Uncharacterized protein ChrSW_0145 [Chromobacterium vaccinii]QND87604.1 Uncharacterized protein ChrSV_0145 [Chromobacterium vaccinii]